MPRAALNTCQVPGCPELTAKTRCWAHESEQVKAWKNPGRQKVYASKRWRVLRRRQLADSPWCAQCNNLASEVDHIIPFTDDRDPNCWNPSNFQSLCKKHHSEKTAREVWGRKPAAPPVELPLIHTKG